MIRREYLLRGSRTSSGSVGKPRRDIAQLPEIGKKLDCCPEHALWIAPRNLIAMGGQCEGLGSCITPRRIICVVRFDGFWDRWKFNVIVAYPYAHFQARRRRPRLVLAVEYARDK